ncbi:MAG: PAS domain S-box protein [Verrucomicrobia bacterium]|nr:PAS domain S-box protein [Verrucomicrobiota bacterium]
MRAFLTTQLAVAHIPAPGPAERDWGLVSELSIELLTGVAVVLLALYLRELLQRRARELRASEERWRTMFDHAPTAMLEEDLTEVARRLDALRAEGVTDLGQHLMARPELALELFRLVRITAVNRVARSLLRAEDMVDFVAKLRAQTEQKAPSTFYRELDALWHERNTATSEMAITLPDFGPWIGVFQWRVPVRDGQRDLARVLITYTDLTELRTTEQRYRMLFEEAEEGIFETLPHGGFREANPAMARMLGYGSPQELLAATPDAVRDIYVQPARRQEFLAQLGDRHAITGFESEVRRRDGSTIWISENVRAVRDAAGRLQSIQGLVTDVTARRRAELALRASEQRYRTLFERAPIAILEFNYRPIRDWLNGLRAAGVTDLAEHLAARPEQLAQVLPLSPLVGANAAALQLFRAGTVKELIDNYHTVLTPEVAATRKRVYLTMWDGGYDMENNLPIRALNGEIRQVHTHWWIPMADSGPLYERSHLALLDLTEVKAVEIALAAERERLRVTLGAMTEGVITVDPDGVIRFMNDAACALTGWTAEEAAGRSIDRVCSMRHQKTGVPVLAPVATVLVSNRVIDLPAQTVVYRKGEGQLLVDGRCAPMHDTTGRGIGAVVVLRDITERTKLELDLFRASKLESVGLLAGGIAHDFNNILAVIMGNVTLVQLETGLSKNAVRWLQEAERGAHRARDLTQQLLTFAKGGDPVRAAVRLPQVVREAAEFALHGSSARCEFTMDDTVWAADADKGQIGQVVQNLIINAAQAMPQGGVIRVALDNALVEKGALGALAAGRYLKLTITDCGTGIPPEHLARIFEPYFTTKQLGTGLGLATVYSIVKKHRGHVTVESEAGAGTTFRLWLPAAQGEPERETASRSPFDPIRGRILFMDDEEAIRQMAELLLQRLGLEVVTVAAGDAVVREYQAASEAGRRFDVVMLDLTVPGGMGGLQAMRELLTYDPQVRAIVSSGYSSDPVLANFRAHGFRGMVPKPFRVGDLAKTLRAVLEKE